MFLASALVAALLQAASSTAPVDPEKEPFQTLETKLSGAIQAKNVAALDELLAKDFAFMAFLEGRAPLVLNRNEWLKTSEHYALDRFRDPQSRGARLRQRGGRPPAAVPPGRGRRQSRPQRRVRRRRRVDQGRRCLEAERTPPQPTRHAEALKDR